MRRALLLAALLAVNGPGVADEAKLDPFITALEQLQQKYYDESLVGSDRLLAKAEDGVVDSLDPESLVLDSAPAAPGPADPGLVIGVKEGVAWVLDVVEGSPAAAAGVRAGNRLLRVDGEAAYGKKRLEVDRALAGAAGNRAVLLWENSDGELQEATVDRQIPARPAWHRVQVEGVDLIQVFRLDAAAAREIREALSGARSGAGGIAVDLRRCARGDLDAALELADAFLPGGLRMAQGVSGRAKPAKSYLSTAKDHPLEQETVLLIGPGTAGAAELFAAALQGQHRAVTVGRRTFGFVGRQKEFVLASEGKRRLRLTVERFLTPDQVSLTGTGVGADLAAEVPGPHDALRTLERRRVVEAVVDRLLKAPPAAYDAAAITAGELKLTAANAKGKSVAEQRGEFEQAFELVLRAVLQNLALEVPREELDQARLTLISRARVELARRQMKPEEALAVALREDPEVALGTDTLKSLRKLAPAGPRATKAAGGRGKS